jgi:hypothetical protein
VATQGNLVATLGIPMATDWKDIMKGVQRRELDTEYAHVRIHYSADPLKDAAWVRRTSAKYGGVDSPIWRREFEIDYSAVTGQPVYPMLCSDHSQIHPIEGTVFRTIDHGIRHPMCCLWVVVNKTGDRHVFREFYRSGGTVETNCAEVLRLSEERVSATFIDPATKQRVPMGATDNKPVSVLSLYNKALDKPCRMADNSKAGYDTVRTGLLSTIARRVLREGSVDETSEFCKTYFREYRLTTYELEQMAARPALTFDPTCLRVFREMRNLRFRDVAGDPTTKGQPEEVIDVDDDGPDCVRYAMQSKLTFNDAVHYEVNSPFWHIQQKRKKGSQRYAYRF